jgi:16S rRNA (uracil1498-N3)-methyltransferase
VPRFFIEPKNVSSGDKITLIGEDARHISFSLRARPGDEYILCDTCNYEYICKITEITSDEVVLELVEKKPCEAEPDVKVTLYQALIKGDKFDAVVQKAVELGVHRIVPVISERCVSRPDAKQLEKKIERWQKISKAAAMQCARSYVPEIAPVVEYKNAIEQIKNADCGFICYEAEPHEPMKKIFEACSSENKSSTYSFFVGPEGGISEKEAEVAKKSGLPLASLGKRILRTETAPLCVISSIMFFSDNLN